MNTIYIIFVQDKKNHKSKPSPYRAVEMATLQCIGRAVILDDYKEYKKNLQCTQ